MNILLYETFHVPLMFFIAPSMGMTNYRSGNCYCCYKLPVYNSYRFLWELGSSSAPLEVGWIGTPVRTHSGRTYKLCHADLAFHPGYWLEYQSAMGFSQHGD